MIKKIKIEGKFNDPLDIDLDTPIDGGGEGEIYSLPVTDYLLKLYKENILNESREAKVLALCDRYETFKFLIGNEQYALPEKPAIEVNNREIAGFVMRNMGKLPNIVDLSFDENDFKDKNGFKLNDNTALELIYQMYKNLLRLHESNIILGDLNPTNILYNPEKKCPVFIDIDSAQLGKYPCIAATEDYLDPVIEESGKNTDGWYEYSRSSDCFSLAVICYELFVGGRPYEFRTKPPEEASIRKIRRICIINFLEDSDFGIKNNIELVKQGPVKIWIERLKLLENKDPLLYKYFFDTFVFDKRVNLLTQLPKNDKRNPGYTLFNKNKGQVKTIKDILMENFREKMQDFKDEHHSYKVIDSLNWNKLLKQYESRYQYTFNLVEMPKDSKAFMMFVDNLGFDYSTLIKTGNLNE